MKVKVRNYNCDFVLFTNNLQATNLIDIIIESDFVKNEYEADNEYNEDNDMSLEEYQELVRENLNEDGPLVIDRKGYVYNDGVQPVLYWKLIEDELMSLEEMAESYDGILIEI